MSSIRLGFITPSATALMFVPPTPLLPAIHIPSPDESVAVVSNLNPLRVTDSIRPMYSPTAFGVSNDATSPHLPYSIYDDAPRVKLLAGLGVKSIDDSPMEARFKSL